MNNYFDFVDDYLNGQLSETDKTKFELELEHNDELGFAVKEHSMIQSMQEHLIEEDIQSSINTVVTSLKTAETVSLDERQPSKGKVRFLNKGTLAVAASTIVLLGLAYFSLDMFESEHDNRQELFGQFYNKSIAKTVRGENNEVDVTQCDKAHQLMDQQDFKSAEAAYNQIQNQANSSCLMRADWHLALSNYMENDEAEMNHYLNKIVANRAHDYYDKAVKFQQVLDSD